MNYSYCLRIFWCCLWGIIFEGASFNLEKIVSGPRVSVRSLYKKDNHSLPDRQRRSGLTIVANKCSIMPLAGIRPGDGGTLTIVANKISVVRNAPCRMNMHLPRRPDPCPLLLPRSELHRCHLPVLPCHRTHVALRRFVLRCTFEEQGPRLPEQSQSLYQLGSSR
jgi:hypothetical protein